jgi:glycine/D-amino acid oxidase-like deaminating enzyme
VLGESAALPGYFVCMAPTGFTLGPLVARLLAAKIARDEPLPDEYAPDRKGVP